MIKPVANEDGRQLTIFSINQHGLHNNGTGLDNSFSIAGVQFESTDDSDIKCWWVRDAVLRVWCGNDTMSTKRPFLSSHVDLVKSKMASHMVENSANNVSCLKSSAQSKMPPATKTFSNPIDILAVIGL